MIMKLKQRKMDYLIPSNMSESTKLNMNYKNRNKDIDILIQIADIKNLKRAFQAIQKISNSIVLGTDLKKSMLVGLTSK